MYLENLVFDAADTQLLGRFWEAAIGGERLTDGSDAFETRLAVQGGPVLDLCFQRVTEPQSDQTPRLHLDLAGGPRQADEVDRLIALGARRLDIGQGDVPWVVLADPEGNPCCVMDDRETYAGTGPIAALPLDSADPLRDMGFWSWLTGWTEGPGTSLRHPSQRGPILALCPEEVPKGPEKNRLHLDIRLEDGDDPGAVTAGIEERGGRELHPGWGDLPWRIYADPSGNELCVLPARS